MLSLTLEVTNLCNRNCLHCFRDKAEPREFLPLDLAEAILTQARALRIREVCITGGEPATYPHLEELVGLVADLGFKFNLVTNGFQFAQALLPLLSRPRIKPKLDVVCFSLDGARAETHDALRGPGSFKEVVEAVSLCKLAGIPRSLKSVITNFNKEELTELALLGAAMGLTEHGFIFQFPTPRAVRAGVIPPPEEQNRIVEWILGSLALTVKGQIVAEGYTGGDIIFSCCTFQGNMTVDHQGHLIYCCNISHVVDEDGVPSRLGRELLADLREVSLKEGVARHFQTTADLVNARLADMDSLAGMTHNLCYWCMKYFNKLDWLKGLPDSPWAVGVFPGG